MPTKVTVVLFISRWRQRLSQETTQQQNTLWLPMWSNGEQCWHRTTLEFGGIDVLGQCVRCGYFNHFCIGRRRDQKWRHSGGARINHNGIGFSPIIGSTCVENGFQSEGHLGGQTILWDIRSSNTFCSISTSWVVIGCYVDHCSSQGGQCTICKQL